MASTRCEARVDRSRGGRSVEHGALGIDDALLKGLGKLATRVEAMKARGAFTLSGTMEALDGTGHPTETKELVMRSTPTSTPHDRVVKIIRYVEDGRDKTAEAQKKADERRAKRKSGEPGAKT